MNEKIRSLYFEDEEEIIHLIDHCLKNNDNLTIEHILYTKRNVHNFYKLHILPAMVGRHPIFGFFENQNLIGLSCASLEINELYDCAQKTAHGIITMVHKEYRSKGISTELRNFMLLDLKSRGVKKFLFDISQNNKASVNSATKVAEKFSLDAKIICIKGEINIDDY